MVKARDAVHAALGLVGLRTYRTGKGALGWLTRNSELAGRTLGHPHVFFPDAEDKHRWVQALGIRTVIDVGAHQGEAARRLRALLPDAEIISFEPLPDCFRALEEVSRTITGHRCRNLAIGERSGEVTMHQNEFTPASSLLATAERMGELMPFAAESKPVTVRVETLDRALSEFVFEGELMVKIDVQGYERQVIAGAPATLGRARLVVVETSFQRIYRDQPLFDDVYRALTDGFGFRYGGSWDRQESPTDGAPLQEDSIFLRHE